MAPGDTTYDPATNLVTIKEASDFVLIELPNGTLVCVCGIGMVYLKRPDGKGSTIDLLNSVPWRDDN